MRAAELGWPTVGWDVDAPNLARALERGAIGAAAPSLEALAAGCDVLVLAAPLDAVVEQLRELAARPPQAELTIDVASVMMPAAAAGRGIAGFVATHPIAGNERSGAGAADARLFAGKPWALDPSPGEPSVARARSFIEAMGGVPVPVAAADHDRIVAATSHLPQLLSVALGVRFEPDLDDADVRALCGSGLASMLRLGASSWPMWRPILAANHIPIAQEVRRLADILQGVADALEAGTPEVLHRDFAAAARAAVGLGSNVAPPGGVDSVEPAR